MAQVLGPRKHVGDLQATPADITEFSALSLTCTGGVWQCVEGKGEPRKHHQTLPDAVSTQPGLSDTLSMAALSHIKSEWAPLNKQEENLLNVTLRWYSCSPQLQLLAMFHQAVLICSMSRSPQASSSSNTHHHGPLGKHSCGPGKGKVLFHLLHLLGWKVHVSPDR